MEQEDASRSLLVKLASGENPRYQPRIKPARTGRFEVEAHQGANVVVVSAHDHAGMTQQFADHAK
jgi:hypothetical protein